MLSISLQHTKNTNPLSPIYRYQQQQSNPISNEQNFVQKLTVIANQIVNTLQKDKEQYQSKVNARQKQYIHEAEQQENTIEQLKILNKNLSSENSELNMKLDQSLRQIKRNEMKIQLLNNKIRQLSHDLTEKQAVIKYLENKNQENSYFHSKKSTNNSLTNINISLEESLNTFKAKSKDLSFAKVKQTKMKFQDYASTSSHIQHQHQQSQYMTGLKNKSKRIRTESSYEIKQNRNHDNFNNNSKTALHNFVNSNKMWTNSNDKTLSKKMRHNNSSFTIQNSREGRQAVSQHQSMNFNHSAYFYKPQHYSLLAGIANTQQMLN